MAILGGPNEVVVANSKQLPGISKSNAGLVGLFERGDPVLFGAALDLQAVFVSAGEKHRFVAQETMPAGEGIGVDCGVGVPDMGNVVDVVNRRGDVERAHVLEPKG